MVGININIPTIDLTDFNLTDVKTEDTANSKAAGVVSAYTIGFPNLSDEEVAAMLGMEYTGDRDQDQLVQDAVEQARNQNAIATGTAPSAEEIAARTAAFEETMQLFRDNPEEMFANWFGEFDKRRFSVSDILRIAASFAIPFASGAIVNALNLSGATAFATDRVLQAAFSEVVGSDVGPAVLSFGSDLERLGELAGFIEVADQAGGALDSISDIAEFVSLATTTARTPQNIIESIESQSKDARDDAEEEEVSLLPDADLLGRTQIFEGGVPSDVYIPEMEDLPIPAVEELPLEELTIEPVTFETDAGGGGGAPAATAEAEQQAAEAAAQAEQQPATTATTTPVGQESDIIDLQHIWVYLGNGRFRNIRTGQEDTDPNYRDIDYQEGEVYSRGDETPVTDVAPQEEPEEDTSLIQEVFTTGLSASDMAQAILQDNMADQTVTTGQEQGAATGGTGGGTEGGTGAGEGPGSGDGSGDGLGVGLGGTGMLASKTTPFKRDPYTPPDLPFEWELVEPIRLFDVIDYNKALRKI